MRLHQFPPALVIILFSMVSLWGCKHTVNDTQHIYLENKKVRLGFNSKNGAFVIFDDLSHQQSLLDTTYQEKSPWQINFRKDAKIIPVDMALARQFRHEKTDASTLTLHWLQFDHADYPNLHVTVSVRLDLNQSFSYWKIHLSGIEGKQVERVIFPRISGLKDMGEEYLAVSNWTGSLMENPRQNQFNANWRYPGMMGMQLVTLYNPGKIGFYAACNDSLSFTKDFAVSVEKPRNFIYQIDNYPEIDLSKDSYSPAYEAVIGSYKGDWFTAAEHYRDWATQQKWCKESRFKKGLIPDWAQETALWVWNRGKSPGVLIPAAELKQKLGLPVSVLWHWWHGCSYDDGFPEYVPPREGRSRFIKQVEIAKQQGVNALVYMNQRSWGTSTESFVKENATLSTIKNINGKEEHITYNIFSKKALTTMCMATEFWRNKYASLSDTVVNNYHLSGIYMDQTCLSSLCYDPSHQHPVGGGNWWLKNSGKLSTQIRNQTKGNEMPVLSGEGACESWLPHLDLFLTLEASRERYAGIGAWKTIPMFQAVYHQYAISYGNFTMLVIPPYDELWPKEFTPKDTLQLQDEKYNDHFLLDQARGFVWGIQPMIANYRSFLQTERKPEMDYLARIAKIRMQGLKYLLYGKYVRMPEIPYPKKELKISKLTTYEGREANAINEYQGEYPLIYSSAWKADDGTLGVSFASISDQAFPLNVNLKANEYGLPKSGKVSVIDESGKRFLTAYQKGEISINMELPPKGICIIEVEP